MKKIRIHNDITLSIPLSGLTTTQVADLTFKVFAIESDKEEASAGVMFLNAHEHHHEHKHMAEMATSISGSNLIAVWKSDVQKIGKYDIVVCAENTSGNKAAGDVVGAIELVKHTEDEADGNNTLINASTTVTLPTITLNFVTVGGSGSAIGSVKPDDGWAKSDLDSSVQASLDKADNGQNAYDFLTNYKLNKLEYQGEQKLIVEGIVYNLEDIKGKADKVDDKVEKVEGKGLSTNDYTNEEKAKLTKVGSDIGTLESLSTEEKTNLVSAINEVNGKSGGTIIKASTSNGIINTLAKNKLTIVREKISTLSINALEGVELDDEGGYVEPTGNTPLSIYIVRFTTDDNSDCQVVLPNYVKLNTEYSYLEKGNTFELSIFDNVALIAEV